MLRVCASPTSQELKLAAWIDDKKWIYRHSQPNIRTKQASISANLNGFGRNMVEPALKHSFSKSGDTCAVTNTILGLGRSSSRPKIRRQASTPPITGIC
mmetsp:Transcript_11808/g.22610  ORF Transcript_11808/g.22610 Transcript_11808/m.22610 type:complete len:99 (-) Transcript_11808:826-1122(-)